MKHAFLIIAHNKYNQLQKLINLLDDKRFDIYIHIDKKSELPILYSLNANLHILNNRIDVRWGDLSQIRCELALFEYASSKYTYEYYHLISGIDLPIKTNDYIINFFEQNKGKEFINFVDETNYVQKRIGRYILGTRFFRPTTFLEQVFNYLFRTIQPIIDIFYKKNLTNIEYKMGANWVSVTHDFCKFLISNKCHILKKYKHTLCADEIYKQTLCWNSRFRNNIFDLHHGYRGCVRLIDWVRGNPYVWGADLERDKKIISKSGAIFIRKIDLDKYPDFVCFIEKSILKT